MNKRIIGLIIIAICVPILVISAWKVLSPEIQSLLITTPPPSIVGWIIWLVPVVTVELTVIAVIQDLLVLGIVAVAGVGLEMLFGSDPGHDWEK